MMNRSIRAAGFAWLVAACAAAPAQTVIFDNASTLPGALRLGLVTNVGAGGGGLDVSSIFGTDTSFGASSSGGGTFRLADDFTVPAGQSWIVTAIRGYAYQTNATTNPITAGTAQIFNGSPLAGGTVIGGSATTNILTGTPTFTNIYRTTSTTFTNTARQIYEATLTFAAPVVLGPGTYFADYGFTFGGAATGFTPPLSLVNSSGVTGNALQANAGVYAALTDGGSLAAKGIPFQIVGTVVPEPGSMALCGVAVAGGLGAWRRRRAAK